MGTLWGLSLLLWGQQLDLVTAFVDLAKKINPAVVNISTEYKLPGYRDPFLEMLEPFFGFRIQPRIKPLTSLGTGFVIREDGLIVTNHHVIAGASKIQVQFEEKGRLFEAQVIGSDDRSDVALLKIEGRGFPVLKLGDSDKIQVGEWVAAFGNPFGNGHTMTKGIISAIGRDISEINRFPLIQTDAPINPGNSGGPLVNLKGEVIGVNAAIDARAQGIGFAIPINGVKKIIPDLEKYGKLQRGFIGVSLIDLDLNVRLSLGLPDELEGVLVAQVEPDSPAARAGIKPYDILIEFGGRKIRSANELRDAVADAPIGSSQVVKVWRDGKILALTVTVASRGSGASPLGWIRRKLQPSLDTTQSATLEWGFVAVDLTPQWRQNYQIPPDIKGVLVTQVLPGSAAAASGLMNFDVILEVNRKPTTDVNTLIKLLKPKKPTLLRIWRQGSIILLPLRS